MYPVPLKDILEIVEGNWEDEFTSSGLELDCRPEQNLIMRTIRLFRKEHDIPPLKVHLHKAIPFGAGLGGGSSDAAETLKILAALYIPDMKKERLKSLAAQIGSDCPFFLERTPSLATGRGEVLKPVDIDLSGYFLVLVKPPFGISTSKAYSLLKTGKKSLSPSQLMNKDISVWNDELVNDFELPLSEIFSALYDIKQTLYKIGAAYASLTGSGSAVYGIFKSETEKPDFPGCFVWKGRL
jgi:4-diphosphocytidyl-2-C-methyl-D-erythritol kinase